MAHLLIIELPGGNDADLLQAARSRGDSFVFLTSALAHYRRQPEVRPLLAAACEQIEVPGFDAAAVDRRVLDAHARQPFDAVLCLVEIRLVDAARLARRLGLPFLNPASAALLRDKYEVRRRLREHGLAQPAFAPADGSAALHAAVARLGLPLLIKPVDGCGSQDIVLLRHPEDLDPLLSPLDHLLPRGADRGLGVRGADRLLVERYMHGRFVGCDTWTRDGRHELLGVHEKLLAEPPSFALRGGTFVPDGPPFDALRRHVFDALDAVGFDCGAAHVEVMLTADGPRLVEINPRLVGAKIPRLLGHALGRSLHADLIDLHAGRAPAQGSGVPPRVAVLRWIVAEATGVLDEVVLPPRDDPAVRCVEILKRPGDVVRPALENADRIGYVMVCGPGRAESEALAADFVARTAVRVRPPPRPTAARAPPGLEFGRPPSALPAAPAALAAPRPPCPPPTPTRAPPDCSKAAS